MTTTPDLYEVRYIVQGGGHFTAGPYATQAEAEEHMRDIFGCEHVTEVSIVRLCADCASGHVQ